MSWLSAIASIAAPAAGFALGGPVGALIGSGVGGAISSNSAANAQRRAANQASDTQLAMFNQNREDQAPWRQAGIASLDELLHGLGIKRMEGSNQEFGGLTRNFGAGDYTQDPGYQFRLQQGERAINNNALARGRYNSGATLKALQDYNSGLASQEYGNAFNRFTTQQGNRFNRLASVAGLGQTATQQTNADRSALGSALASNTIGAGNAAAAGVVGGTNAINSAVGQGLNFWQGQQMLDSIRNRIIGYQPSGAAITAGGQEIF